MSDPAEAIGLLAFVVGWGGGVLPVYLDAGVLPEAFIDLRSGNGGKLLARRAARWDMDRSLQVEIGLPERERRIGVAKTTVLWCWLETRDQVRRAHRFRPAPTMVLRMGRSCRRLAIWALREEVAHVSVVAANKRLAYALHAPQKWAEPEKLRIPLPGTFLRVGRRRPSPVLVTCAELDRTYARSQVVARLREPPRPYMDRLRAGEVAR